MTSQARKPRVNLVPSPSWPQKQSAQCPGGPEAEMSWDLNNAFLDQDSGTWFLSAEGGSRVSLESRPPPITHRQDKQQLSRLGAMEQWYQPLLTLVLGRT